MFGSIYFVILYIDNQSSAVLMIHYNYMVLCNSTFDYRKVLGYIGEGQMVFMNSQKGDKRFCLPF